jgi:PHD/YefM family antitoxin component YafN of YafNO toxin-antitoxin module
VEYEIKFKEAIIMRVDDYESVVETMNVEVDERTMKRIRQAEKDLKKGKGGDLDKIREKLIRGER